MVTRTEYRDTPARRSRTALTALLVLLGTAACAGSNPQASLQRTDLHERRIDALEAERRARFYTEERARLDAENRACLGACAPGYRCTR